MPFKHNALITSTHIEWHTPGYLMARIAAFLDHDFLDPASPGVVNGLDMVWQGRVYLNPPYGRQIGKWVEKALSDPIDELIILVPARTDTGWFSNLWPLTLCFFKGRLNFNDQRNLPHINNRGDRAPFPSVLAYHGPRRQAFMETFSDLGHCFLGEGLKARPTQLPLQFVA